MYVIDDDMPSIIHYVDEYRDIENYSVLAHIIDITYFKCFTTKSILSLFNKYSGDYDVFDNQTNFEAVFIESVVSIALQNSNRYGISDVTKNVIEMMEKVLENNKMPVCLEEGLEDALEPVISIMINFIDKSICAVLSETDRYGYDDLDYIDENQNGFYVVGDILINKPAENAVTGSIYLREYKRKWHDNYGT